jgi:hypothetical protein
MRSFVEGSFEEYLLQMGKDGEWGDHVALTALAEVYEVRIRVLTLVNDRYSWPVLGSSTSGPMIQLFLTREHYECLHSSAETARLRMCHLEEYEEEPEWPELAEWRIGQRW